VFGEVVEVSFAEWEAAVFGREIECTISVSGGCSVTSILNFIGLVLQ
jgi:hypothetical protein